LAIHYLSHVHELFMDKYCWTLHIIIVVGLQSELAGPVAVVKLSIAVLYLFAITKCSHYLQNLFSFAWYWQSADYEN